MGESIPTRIQDLLEETRRELEKIYAERLREIILFGSFARGDFSEESDVDLLVLLDKLKDVEVEREKYISAISRLSLKYDTVLSVIPFDYDAYRTKKSPLLLNVRKEGVPL